MAIAIIRLTGFDSIPRGLRRCCLDLKYLVGRLAPNALRHSGRVPGLWRRALIPLVHHALPVAASVTSRPFIDGGLHINQALVQPSWRVSVFAPIR